MIKFVLGLTDEVSQYVFPKTKLEDMFPAVDSEMYSLSSNDTSIEKATIEWELDATLPAVNALFLTVNNIKSKVNYLSLLFNRYNQFQEDFYIELANLWPNDTVILQKYTDIDYENINTGTPPYASLELDEIASYRYNNISDHESLNYAFQTKDFSFLLNGPQDKIVYPAFRISFYSESERTYNKFMSEEQQKWMTDNKEQLASKGYYATDLKNKLGSLPIGTLIGSPEDAYRKLRQYNKVCRVDIIEEMF